MSVLRTDAMTALHSWTDPFLATVMIYTTYCNTYYVIELKRWYGPKAHQKGLQQLSDYLDMYSLKQGYLLIYDFNKNKE